METARKRSAALKHVHENTHMHRQTDTHTALCFAKFPSCFLAKAALHAKQTDTVDILSGHRIFSQ